VTNQQKVIQINYESQTGWPFPLLNAINANPDSLALMNHYRSTSIGDRLISLSTKIVILDIVVCRLNQSLQLMNNDIANKREHLVECVDSGYAYTCQDTMLPFQLVLDVETFIFEARSSFDMLVEFANLLHDTFGVFSISITKSNISQVLAKSGKSAEWIATLKTIRDMGIHEKAPWVGIVANNDGQNPLPVIVFDDTHNAPISDACYSIEILNSISRGISDLYAFIMHQAVSRLSQGVS